MADKRKLQGEIDRCLKKVTEGVETFEDIWQKVHSAANANQKEKYEADLKKEIKKLQRLRDQIKTWLASSDIKDKRVLMDNRKLIETQMERFKVVERETKTKAYSKEGLGAAAKLDPATKEKSELTNWISHQIESLNIQLDQFESEVEGLSCGNKKKKLDKDRQDRFDELKNWQDKHLVHIRKLEHIMRMVDNDALPLDQIRKIRDDVEYYVDSNQDPDFEENEFVYDELDLDDIDSDEELDHRYLTALSGNASSPPNDEDYMDKLSTTPTSTNSSSPSPSPGLSNHSKDKSEECERKRHKSQDNEIVVIQKNKNNQASSSLSSTNNSSSNNKVPNTPTKHNSSTSLTSKEENGTNHLPNMTPPSLSNYSVAVGSQNSNSGSPLPTTTRSVHNAMASVWQRNNSSTSSPSAMRHLNFNESSTTDSKTQANSIDHVAVSNSNANNVSSVITSVVNSVSTNSLGNPSIPPAPSINSVVNLPSSSASVSSSSTSSSSISSMMLTPSSATSTLLTSQANTNSSSSSSTSSKLEPRVVMNGPHSAGGPFHNTLEGVPSSSPDSMSSLKSIAQQAVVNAGLENQIPSSQSSTMDTKVPFNSSSSQVPPQPTVPSQDSQSQVLSQQQQQQQQQQPQTTTIHLNRLLGVAPLGPVPLSKEHFNQLMMLEAAFHHLPHPSDSERLRHYLPRNPCPTPTYYPQLPPPSSDSVEFFQRLSTETLFFIFYYMEGTKAQYLAAKALKKQSWRFHTKYMMWFQRHEEPKTITEDYEQGTYIYFDYEKWGQRKKEGFTFEYRYLEDRDLN
ncbi:hypothetical protein CHS0354_028101 [Potamilus streckersoni]|uniref:CCR4-NOT transcription complex subunit 3 n=1 Tax=Potamilus streckersoni TaxID=2493646 RepID=A0AAE0WDJ2_9BIVA|nr:hypothetical protein CHS0354_028101 [Potamilus streckersoni]